MPTVRYTTVDSEVTSELRSGVKRDYVPDPLGSTVALLDSTQTKTDTFGYWPYGESAARTGTTATPFQFVGTREYYQNGSDRSYADGGSISTRTGRWLSEKSKPFEEIKANNYAYAKNSPASKGMEKAASLLKIGIKPVYGKYCGPQTEAGCGPGVDPLDECCRVHDNCFAGVTPPCTAFNQLFRAECRACNKGLCDCAKGTSCQTLACKAMRLGIIGYACPAGMFS